MHRHAGAWAGAKFFNHVGAAVAVRVPQRRQTIAMIFGIDVPVGSDAQESQHVGVFPGLRVAVQIVGDHQRAEAWRQIDRTVIEVRRRQRRAGQSRNQNDCEDNS